jgi:hypothetical protein
MLAQFIVNPAMAGFDFQRRFDVGDRHGYPQSAGLMCDMQKGFAQDDMMVGSELK